MPVQTEIESLCQRARECVRRRQIPEAIAFYEQALQVDERDQRPHEGIATAAFLVADYDRAEKHFKRLSQLDPRRADPLVNLGAVYNRRSSYVEAVRVLRQALSKNRKCAEAYYNLGIAYKGQNQLSMAISAYKEAIRLAPDMPEAYQNLANTYVDMGNLQQAILNFHRALQINPAFEKARRGLEHAQQLVEAQAQSASPFGRLVDAAHLSQRSTHASPSPPLRALTEVERLEDRQAVQRLAGAFETAAQEVLRRLKEDLTPALLGVSHAFAQSDDRRRLLAAQTALMEALELHRAATGPLLKAGDALQAYEEDLARRQRPN